MVTALDISADELVRKLLALSNGGRRIALLDSCGVGHLGSHLLIAGIDPVESVALAGATDEIARSFQELLSRGRAAVCTLSYDMGPRLHGLQSRHKTDEPEIYIALFDSLVVHDYRTGRTHISGRSNVIESLSSVPRGPLPREVGDRESTSSEKLRSNLSRQQYLRTIDTIKEHIRRGETYQTNLTQQLTVPLMENDSPGDVFRRLRKQHPAPFAAFIDRGDSQVVSASPERFFRIDGRTITTSPIKGTRPRGSSREEDDRLRAELLSSEKDRAENTMIVDLLRNDLGRVCEFGSVEVKKLCDLEEHPTLFHLVSTVEGKLGAAATIWDVVTALFPCGSITGAPKNRTMRIIDALEPTARGLSMGAIGYYIPESGFAPLQPGFDFSVAIRTMVIRARVAAFNIGGGITIESDPEAEYDESLLKAKALLSALKAEPLQ